MKREFGITVEFNSKLTKPWTLCAWDTANKLEIFEGFEEKQQLLTRVAEVKRQFGTEVAGLLD